MSSYPKWLYHATKAAMVVRDEAAHKALGEGWYESPAEVSTSKVLDDALAKNAAELANAQAQAAANTKPSKKVK
jgi:hypothetical protein